MKRYVLGLLIAGTVLSAAGFILRVQYGDHNSSVTTPVQEPVTKPPADPHGCDLPGGFVWCEPKQKCLQLWNEKCEGVISASDSGKTVPTQ